jgi:hypothetical protein
MDLESAKNHIWWFYMDGDLALKLEGENMDK